MKINPIYQKELKINVRTMKMAWILFFFNLLIGCVGLFVFYLTFEYSNNYYNIDYTNIINIYYIIAGIEMALILFVIPGLNAGAIAGERERQTLEILLTTKLRPIDIILGKLAASISSVILLVISSLPIISIISAIGGVGFLDLLQYIGLTIVTAIYIGSLGIFFSVISHKNLTATVVAYGSVVALVFGTTGIVWGAYMIISMNTPYTYSVTDIPAGPDVGYLLLILLVNPIVTLVAMITDQVGSPTQLAQYLQEFGYISPFIIEYWYLISIVTQLIISGILLVQSGRLLDPTRQKKNHLT